MAHSDLPFFQKPEIDDLMPDILREARHDRDEIRRLTDIVDVVEAMMLTAYGVAGGVLCVPPGPAQSAFVDAMAAYRLSRE